MRKKLLILLLILLCSIQSTFAGTFKDTEAYPWAEEAIENMVNNGYISGYTDGTFRPEKEITRAEFVSVINKMNQLTEASELSFTDVKSTHWAYEQIKIAVAAGYINGYPDGSFRPDALITKEQVAAMFNNLYAFDTASSPHLIKDLSKVSPWAVQAVVNVVSNEVMQLDSEGKFNGKVPAKRVDTVLSMNQIVVKAIAMIGEITQKQPDVQPIVPPVVAPPVVAPIDSEVQKNLLIVKQQLTESVLPVMQTDGQRQVINIICGSISSYLANPSYDIEGDVSSAKGIINDMTESEKDYLKEKIQFYVEVGALYQLNSIFNIFKL